MSSFLLCTERANGVTHALLDEQMRTSQQVFDNMLQLEMRYVPHVNPIDSVQTMISSENRRVLTGWMLEVSEECKFEDSVCPLAVSLMDRFLCLGPLSPAHFQLTACTALFIAAKLRSVYLFPRGTFEYHSDFTITSSQIVSWEALMTIKLGWDLESVTANDFIDHIYLRTPALLRLPKGDMIRTHAHILAHLAITDAGNITEKPSVIATAAIVGALRGLNISVISTESLCRLTKADTIAVENLATLNEKLLANYTITPHQFDCFTL